MFGHSYFGPAYFGGAYFGPAAGLALITDTDILQKPVNCVLAGQQPYKFRESEYEIPAYRRSEKSAATRSGVRRLRGAAPSFTVKTDHRGYD